MTYSSIEDKLAGIDLITYEEYILEFQKIYDEEELELINEGFYEDLSPEMANMMREVSWNMGFHAYILGNVNNSNKEEIEYFDYT